MAFSAKPFIAIHDRSFLDASPQDVVSSLTLKEKITLLAGYDTFSTPAIPRLGIPSIRLSDGTNGVRGSSLFKMTPAMAIPNEAGLAATFSLELVRTMGGLIAREAEARSASTVLGPNVNVPRSPLGGRTFETFGEDPTLSGKMAASYIQGLQDEDIGATIKHFVCNEQEHERKAVNSVVSPRALREIYLRPFQIALCEAPPWALMTAYNKLNGVHCSESRTLLLDILRAEWGYEGLVMSDWNGTYSVSGAINNGLDLEMCGPPKWRNPELVTSVVAARKVPIRNLNARALQVVRWAQKCARAQPELAYTTKPIEYTREDPGDCALIRRAAVESICLLKNDRHILPFTAASGMRKIAVIGPNANGRIFSGGGSANLKAQYVITPLQGLRNSAPAGVDIQYALGGTGAVFLPLLHEEVADHTGTPHYTVDFYNQTATGQIDAQPNGTITHDESNFLMIDSLPSGVTADFVAIGRASFKTNEGGTWIFGLSCAGKGRLYLDDTLVVSNWENQTRGSSFFGSGSAEEMGMYTVDAGRVYQLRFEFNSRRSAMRGADESQPLTFTGIRIGGMLHRSVDERLQDAITLAKNSDAVILVAGNNHDAETEGFDRPTLSMPGLNDRLISEIAAVNSNVVVAVQAGAPVTMPWIDKVPAVLFTWYGGSETGNAIGDVIFGRESPSGRLPITFPANERDVPAALSFKSEMGTARYTEDLFVGYKHYYARGIAPLFAFGHGLSYSTFDYSDLRVSVKNDKTPADLQVVVSCRVTNTGSVKGSHSVHFYVSHPVATTTSVIHPKWSLQTWAKVTDLPPQESEEVTVELDKYAFSHWSEMDNVWVIEPGLWTIEIRHTAELSADISGQVTLPELEWSGL
ncbi:putative glycosyl hydrolase [Naematelia encephala]|uniref:beta-glucosidase n=1 Tax=Naematelia encephala TaxID=71784 RepID=A0A1Y2AWB7_9TREE|nr:putative glycosyl hydrolase [Naematelia encephala]